VYNLTAFLNDERFKPRRIVFCDGSRSFSTFFGEPVERVSLYQITFQHCAIRFRQGFFGATFLYAAFSIDAPGQASTLRYMFTIDADGTTTFRTADDFDRLFHPFREGRKEIPDIIFGTEWLTYGWVHSPVWEPMEDPHEKQQRRVATFRDLCKHFRVDP